MRCLRAGGLDGESACCLQFAAWSTTSASVFRQEVFGVHRFNCNMFPVVPSTLGSNINILRCFQLPWQQVQEEHPSLEMSEKCRDGPDNVKSPLSFCLSCSSSNNLCMQVVDVWLYNARCLRPYASWEGMSDRDGWAKKEHHITTMEMEMMNKRVEEEGVIETENKETDGGGLN